MLALFLALFLSIMGVRALGETDINPVSGISKLTQLIFALVTPAGSKNAVVINLLAGGISDAGALQAGDLLQDLKTGHLLGASPKAQFWGQLIGSGVGAVVSAAVYKLYTKVYTIPGGLFQVPTGYVWIFTARLVTGSGLPSHTPVFAASAAALWAGLTMVRIYGQSQRQADGTKGAPWVPYVPGGIAVAVGMYNTPSFTLARTAGGVLAWWWTRWKGREETPIDCVGVWADSGRGIGQYCESWISKWWGVASLMINLVYWDWDIYLTGKHHIYWRLFNVIQHVGCEIVGSVDTAHGADTVD